MTQDPFHQRVVVITGGAGGIGRALATACAGRGARLVLADLDAAALTRATTELEATGAEAIGVVTDVTDRASVDALARAAIERFGAVHIVCNNAGVALFGRMTEATHADWEYTMNVNFWGAVHGLETFVPILRSQGQGGHIVNTASMAGLVGMAWLGVYAASKFAVVGLSESLFRELRPEGIGVSVLCPMIVDTNINQNSARMRPADLRNPGEPASVLPVAEIAASMKGGVVPPHEVARRVLRGIERGDLYILTHPEQREFLRRRAASLDALFEPDRW